jgi:hypothetical protein
VDVNRTHPDYDLNVAAWLRARDVIAGEDAIKAGGERYLPRLVEQDDAEYYGYKSRACFFNATNRTADGYLGLIFRREPTVKLPDRTSGVGGVLRYFSEDVDLMGTGLSTYSKAVVREVLITGRAGTLIDWEDVEAKAYVVRFAAEDIINWHTGRVNGRTVLTYLALKETADLPDYSGTEEQIRVLRLEEGESGAQAQCVVEIWRKAKAEPVRGFVMRGLFNLAGSKSSRWQMVERRLPLRLGRPLALIPFVFHGPRHSLPSVDELPLKDIIFCNLDHYRLDADYKHGLHWTALPTPWVSGFKVEKGKTLKLGSSSAWTTDQVGAAVGFLEFKGGGLSSFVEALNRAERQMAVQGSRMLEETKRVGETADAIELRQSSENSVLQTLALSVSDSLSHVLRWVYWWNSTEASPELVGEDVVLIQLNTDFSPKGMSAQELQAVVAAWEAGAISQETMFDLFRRGEVLPVGRTDEEEKRLTAAVIHRRDAEARRGKQEAAGTGKTEPNPARTE